MEKELVIATPRELAQSLARDFAMGSIIDESGLRFLGKELVDTLDGLKIEIFSREHPPPHFRVSLAGDTANFTIKDCTQLNGGLTKWLRNIRKWHAINKQELISVWNRTRPSDCPVGPYVE